MAVSGRAGVNECSWIIPDEKATPSWMAGFVSHVIRPIPGNTVMDRMLIDESVGHKWGRWIFRRDVAIEIVILDGKYSHPRKMTSARGIVCQGLAPSC